MVMQIKLVVVVVVVGEVIGGSRKEVLDENT